MGQVARTGKAQYLEDLSIEAEFRQQVGEESGSAYCWPVSYYRNGGDRLVRWVFVAVDERLAAFSPGERYSLNEVAGDIGGLLRGLNTLHFLRSTFDTTSDAILVVDSLNQVRRANQSAADLFGQDHPRKLVGHLGSFFGSPDEAEPFLSRRAYSRESQVMDAAGKTFPAMVTSRAMPVSIGGKVLAFEDLRSIRRLEELGFLGRVTAEVSVQMQTPLTLASSWMQRIRAFTTDSESREGAEESTVIRDLADRAAVQLRRIQGCLDRIAFFDAKDAFVPRPAIPVSLNDELLRLLGTLPASERDRIDVPNPAQRVVVRVHPEHLGFVLDTLLGFFLRDLPSADKVAVETGRDTQFGWLFCEVYRQAEKNKQAASVKATPLATELGLARRALTQIISGYGGSYETQQAPSDGRIAGVRIALPLCE
jgi:PAS domain-containing protein